MPRSGAPLPQEAQPDRLHTYAERAEAARHPPRAASTADTVSGTNYAGLTLRRPHLQPLELGCDRRREAFAERHAEPP